MPLVKSPAYKLLLSTVSVHPTISYYTPHYLRLSDLSSEQLSSYKCHWNLPRDNTNEWLLTLQILQPFDQCIGVVF